MNLRREGTFQEFEETVHSCIKNFATNPLLAKLNSGQFTMKDYHAFLSMIFQQVYHSSSSFALAGANCTPQFEKIRGYLIRHAEEERTHWEWVIEDLKSTKYDGPDPKECFPKIACQSYISWNYFVAYKQPVARLGIAAVLEGIGASFAKNGANKIIDTLGLKPAQLQFVYGHGDTDVGHTQEIFEVLRSEKLGSTELAWLRYSAEVAYKLYYDMYAEVVR